MLEVHGRQSSHEQHSTTFSKQVLAESNLLCFIHSLTVETETLERGKIMKKGGKMATINFILSYVHADTYARKYFTNLLCKRKFREFVNL